jgi:3-oxoadipate enol-lactonase
VEGELLGYESAGTGPALVLVHGFPFDRRMWAAQGVALADICRVISRDLPGRGLSTGHSADGASIDTYADHVAEVIRYRAGGQAAVAGLSMGGYIALALWRRHPHTITSLILSDTRAGADSEEGREARSTNADIAWREGTIGLAEAMLPRLLAPTTDKSVRDRVLQMFEETPTLTAIADLLAMRDRPDSTETLGSIGVPTLVVRGAEDAIASAEDSAIMAEGIPGACHVTIPAAGHLAPMENPEAWNGAVRDFLLKASAGEG